MVAGVASRGRLAGGAVLVLLVAAALSAATATAGSATMSYPDFSSIAGLSLNGNAAQAGSALRLVPAAELQAGSAWSQTTIDTTQSFESTFRADMHDGSAPPADGMTFAIQSEGPTALGDNGGEHGYGRMFSTGIAPSVALDISVYPTRTRGWPRSSRSSRTATSSHRSPARRARPFSTASRTRSGSTTTQRRSRCRSS
jgi:hypothetical protein